MTLSLACSGYWDTNFHPRLADAGEAVFWRADKAANYGALDKLARVVLTFLKSKATGMR